MKGFLHELKKTDKSIVQKLHDRLFFLTLTIEILCAVLEISDYSFGYFSYVFRVTFLMAGVIVLLDMVYIRRFCLWEWGLFLGLFLVAAIDYKTSGRNEMLRFLLFLTACRDVDMKKYLRIFWMEFTGGCLFLVLLSVAGIFGIVRKPVGDGSEIRFTLGMGDSNALHCMFFMMLLLGMYLFAEKMKWYHYLTLFAANLGLFVMTGCKTAAGLAAVGILASAAIRYTKMAKWRWPHILGILLYGGGLFFSFWAAEQSINCWEPGRPFLRFVDRLITGRITNLYWGNAAHSGAIQSWKLFADRSAQEYFDMGWCRLVYWYGIIPALCVLALLAVLMIQCLRHRDGQALSMLTLLSVYTIMEAHLVSVYIGRNFVVLLLAMYLWSRSAAVSKESESGNTQDSAGVSAD